MILDTLLKNKFSDCIDKILLFGSCAKQSTKGDSDADILVITSSDLDKDVKGGILKEINELNTPVDSDILFYTVDMYEKGSMPLTVSIKKCNIVLYERGA